MTHERDSGADQLQVLAKEIGASSPLIYTEARFDDLFRAPLAPGADRVGMRLELADQWRRELTLVYWKSEGGRIQQKSLTVDLNEIELGSVDKGDLNELTLHDLIRFRYRDIPVGLHAWETVLRTDLDAFADPPGEQAIAGLIDLIELSCQMVAGIAGICEALNPAFFFSGHDCYLSATAKNAFIANDVPSWTPYKYSYNPIFTKESRPYVERGRCLYSRRFMEWDTLSEELAWKEHADKALEKIAALASDYKSANYMVGDFSSFDYRNVVNDANLRYLDENKCFLGGDEAREIETGSLVFVLALHSFADEACINGIDDFVHMTSYFKRVGVAIADRFPGAFIAIRFHPNTLSNIQHPVVQADADLQARLYDELKAVSDRIVISCGSARLPALAKHYRTCVVTRWGTIGRECMYLNVPFFCSPLAPFAKLIANEQVLDSSETVAEKIEAAGNKIIAGEPFEYDRDAMASPSASFFYRRNGEERLPHFMRSRQGSAYMFARGASDPGAAVPLGYRLLRLCLGEAMYKRFTLGRFRAFLVESAESEADRSLLRERLGW